MNSIIKGLIIGGEANDLFRDRNYLNVFSSTFSLGNM